MEQLVRQRMPDKTGRPQAGLTWQGTHRVERTEEKNTLSRLHSRLDPGSKVLAAQDFRQQCREKMKQSLITSGG